MKRNVLIAPALALALMVPQAPAPARAGTFTITIDEPALILIEADAAFENITGLACVGAAGSSVSWLAIKLLSKDTLVAFAGTTAKLKDKAAKLKAKFADRAKQASSGDIRRLDQDSSGKETVNTSEDVKGTMRGKAAYVVDPAGESEFAGTSGKVKVKDQTNGEQVVLDANVAAKLTTDIGGSCSADLDTNGKVVAVRISGVTAGGETFNLRLGR